MYHKMLISFNVYHVLLYLQHSLITIFLMCKLCKIHGIRYSCKTVALQSERVGMYSIAQSALRPLIFSMRRLHCAHAVTPVVSP